MLAHTNCLKNFHRDFTYVHACLDIYLICIQSQKTSSSSFSFPWQKPINIPRREVLWQYPGFNDHAWSWSHIYEAEHVALMTRDDNAGDLAWQAYLAHRRGGSWLRRCGGRRGRGGSSPPGDRWRTPSGSRTRRPRARPPWTTPSTSCWSWSLSFLSRAPESDTLHFTNYKTDLPFKLWNGNAAAQLLETSLSVIYVISI